jgi:uncharacterized DUF497 family protein
MQTEWRGFDWDDANANKNWVKHGVTDSECEEVFFNRPFVLRHDPRHSSAAEQRWHAFGETDRGRRLLVSFTVRARFVRVVSAREMTRRERRFYTSYEKNERSEET